MIKEQLDKIRESALKQIGETDGLDMLNDIRVNFLGKKGELTSILKSMEWDVFTCFCETLCLNFFH